MSICEKSQEGSGGRWWQLNFDVGTAFGSLCLKAKKQFFPFAAVVAYLVLLVHSLTTSKTSTYLQLPTSNSSR